jgi:hypothetical protein
VIGLIGGVVEGSENVFTFQGRVITQDFLKGGFCFEQLEDISYADVLAANAGTAPAFAEPAKLAIISVAHSASCGASSKQSPKPA